MKEFLHRNTVLITSVAVVSVILASIMGFLLVGAKELQEETMKRYDRPLNSEVLGRQGKISQRSKTQIDTFFLETPYVIGGWATKIRYGKLEVPVIHFWSRVPAVVTLMENFAKQQISGKGFSSDELDAMSSQSLRNSEEAKTGLIKCAPLSATNLLTISPDIANYAKSVCRATIPPFSEDVNIGVVVLTTVDSESNGPEIQTIRRMLLQLQIDIFNRDYQGRETWARSVPSQKP